jgi:hypothetical protein
VYLGPARPFFLADLNRRHRPRTVICQGDEIDAYAFSQFPKDPDAAAAGDEIQSVRRALRPLFRLFPQVSVCESNHGERPYKRARQAQRHANTSGRSRSPTPWMACWASRHRRYFDCFPSAYRNK